MGRELERAAALTRNGRERTLLLARRAVRRGRVAVTGRAGPRQADRASWSSAYRSLSGLAMP